MRARFREVWKALITVPSPLRLFLLPFSIVLSVTIVCVLLQFRGFSYALLLPVGVLAIPIGLLLVFNSAASVEALRRVAVAVRPSLMSHRPTTAFQYRALGAIYLIMGVVCAVAGWRYLAS